MGWLTRTYATSIGKKTIMAGSGALLGMFVVVHAAGNATSLFGREIFLAYAAHLHAFGFLLSIFESLLVILVLLHVATGLLLAGENFLARPHRYSMGRNAGGRTPASRTMIYTGAAVLLFIPVHLANFHFTREIISIADLVPKVFRQPHFALIHIVAVLCLAIHVSHGFWSMFQTMGLDHPKYLPVIQGCALLFSLLIGVIFALIPLLAFLHEGFLL
jgi:succinate dehydrogenase / fumarate reductase cytochrome b subunit